MTAVVFGVGVVEAVVVFVFVIIWWAETERFPGRYLSWSPYLYGGHWHNSSASEIRVGVRHKRNFIELRCIDPNADDFDDQLVEAENYARERCVQLNASRKVLARRLPS